MSAERSAAIMLASLLPRDFLVNSLEERIQEYKEKAVLGKESEAEQAFQKIAFSAHLILLNCISKDSVEGAIETIEKMEKVEARRKMFEPGEN